MDKILNQIDLVTISPPFAASYYHRFRSRVKPGNRRDLGWVLTSCGKVQKKKGGQDWKFEIRKAMEKACAVVLCLSKESGARAISGIYPEALDAISAYREYAPGSIFLIPVRLSECEIPPIEIDATRTLKRLEYIDLFPENERGEGIKKLLEAIRTARLQATGYTEQD